MKYKLERAKKANFWWYIGIENNVLLYLRPSMEVLVSTGSSDGFNVGYWETEEEANKARALYLGIPIIKDLQPTKEDCMVAYKCGKLIVEQSNDTWTFMFAGFNFSNNKNRAKPYEFNYHMWMIQDISMIDKIGFILSGKMHRIK